MKTPRQNIAMHVRMYMLGIWGFVSLVYIAGEPVDMLMPFGRFCLLKLLGLASLGLCVYIGIRLRKAGLIPGSEDDNKDDNE